MAWTAEECRLWKISKFLSQASDGVSFVLDAICMVSPCQVLRHAADYKFQLAVRSDGACRIVDIIKLIWWERWIDCNVEDLKTIEQNDDKGRFVVDLNDGTVRCTQGHSIKTVTDDHLRPIPVHLAEDFRCWHGTFRHHLESISEKGLLAGGLVGTRNHVHCTPFYPWEMRFPGTGIGREVRFC